MIRRGRGANSSSFECRQKQCNLLICGSPEYKDPAVVHTAPRLCYRPTIKKSVTELNLVQVAQSYNGFVPTRFGKHKNIRPFCTHRRCTPLVWAGKCQFQKKQHEGCKRPQRTLFRFSPTTMRKSPPYLLRKLWLASSEQNLALQPQRTEPPWIK